jgi:hypothetical protein
MSMFLFNPGAKMIDYGCSVWRERRVFKTGPRIEEDNGNEKKW